MCVHVCVYGVPLYSEECIGCPRTGVTVGCKPSNV